MKYSTSLLTALLIFGLTLTCSASDESGEGTVLEVIDVDNYTYVRLVEGDRWIASESTPVSVGDRIAYKDGALMKDFFSPRLDRTFADIYFARRITVLESHSEKSEEEQIAMAHDLRPADAAGQDLPMAPRAGEIIRHPNGMTIEEILESGQGLEGRQILLNAMIMKVNEGIMGKNWITLQDGTGTPPLDRLIATTPELPPVGETLTVSGVVRNDVSLGFGYDYGLLLEEAVFE